MGRRLVRSPWPDAIQTAYRTQPRLRVFLEGIHEAQGNEEIAFSPYLPTLAGTIAGGGFDLNVQGQVANGFTFLPIGGAVPIGLNLETGYGLGDVRLQWLICDFGRREGHYCQAKLGVEIASLQSERAYQTVANEVAVAYYQVLRAASLRRIAQEAVRRAEDDLGVAKKLEKGGVIEREKVLRVEVQLAQSQRLLDSAEGRSPSRPRRSMWPWAWTFRRRLLSPKSMSCRLRRIRSPNVCKRPCHNAAS